MHAAARRGLPLLSLLFVLSGATGLAYEMVWFKRLSQVFGSSSLAIAAVVACFLLGLGVGALVLGRLADRWRRPVRAYAWCELAIAGLAVILPYELAAVASLAPSLDRLVAGSPVGQALVRFLLAVVVLGPPCFLMGGTLPLLAKRLVRSGLGVGPSTAWLYALNALGAGAGALLTGFVLLPELGMTATGLAAAATNVAIFGLAFLVGEGEDAPASPAEAPAPAPPAARPSARPPLRAVHAAAALTGLSGIGLQIVWTRQLGLMLGGTTYVFAAVLAVFILGISAGSFVFRTRWRGRSVEAWIFVPTLVLVLSALAGRAALPELSAIVGAVSPLRTDAWVNFGVTLGAAFALQGIPTLAMGIVFPALVELTGLGSRDAGRAVGGVYAWNTAGSVVGALGAALFALPAWTAGGTLAVCAALYAAVPILLHPPRPGQVRGAVVSAAALGMLFLPWPEPDPLRTNFGMYLYGARRAESLQDGFEVLSFTEGRTCSVLVLEHPLGRNLRVNGKVDASDSPEDMVTQLGLACVPRFLRPGAKNVLVVGFGSGVTSGASLHWPETRVTCLEIEPAVYAASPYFHSVNHAPERNERYTQVVDDGRSYIQRSDERFDLILSAPSNPWIAGIANLFTVEFYETVSGRLGEEGLLAQWMQVYLLGSEEFTSVLKSLRSVFPHVGVARISDADTILLASHSPIVPSASDLRASRALARNVPGLRADLDGVYGTHDVRTLLVEHLLLDDAGVDRLISRFPDVEPNTDKNLRLEFDAPRLLFARKVPEEQDARRALFAAAGTGTWSDLCAALDCEADQAEAFGRVAEQARKRGAAALALGLVEAGLALDPDQGVLLADRLRFAPRRDPDAFARDAARLIALSPEAAFELGRDLSQRGDPVGGRALLEGLAETYPSSATVWTSLAIVYESLGQHEDARRAIQRSAELDPVNELGRRVRSLLPADEEPEEDP